MKIEVATSRTLKMQLGEFQSVDFFQSAKVKVEKKNLEKYQVKLDEFCKNEITKKVEKELKYWKNLVSESRKREILESEI